MPDFMAFASLPINATNRGIFERAGMLFCPVVSGPDAAAFWKQTLTLAELKAKYPDTPGGSFPQNSHYIDAALENFTQGIFSTSNPPHTQNRFVGHAAFTSQEWDRMLAFLPDLPATFRYAKFDMDRRLLACTPSLPLVVGGTYTPIEALLACGLRRWEDPNAI